MNSMQVLNTGEFNDLTGSHIANVKSTIARYTIPQGMAFALLESHSLEFSIPSASEFPIENDETTTQTVTIPYAFAFADSPRPFRRKLRWQILDGGGNVTQEAKESEVTVSGRTITGPKPASTAGTIRVIYLPRGGNLFLDQVETRGTNRDENTLYEQNILVLHTADQYRLGSVPQLDRSHLVLEDMHLEVAVQTPWKPYLNTPLARISVRYAPQTMDDLLARARAESGVTSLSMGELRAGYVGSWR